MPPTAVHFNGGVNLSDTETVFQALTEHVPEGTRRLPDGETGQRAGWITFQLPRLAAAAGLERIDPKDDEDDPYRSGPTIGLAPGADASSLTWPDLGYATAYLSSYEIFGRLRAAGTIPDSVRFQVQYPTPAAVANLLHPRDRDALLPRYTEALYADLERFLANVDHGDVAVQWDCPVETVGVEWAPESRAESGEKLADLVDRVPVTVPVGLHLCYGDAGHVHMVEPSTLAPQVALATEVAGRVRRPLGWVSFTVPQDRDDEPFFAPLSALSVPAATELYLALVPYHPDLQKQGTTGRQVALVESFLPSQRPWGICTECGMARADRADVPRLLDLHREILAGVVLS